MHYRAHRCTAVVYCALFSGFRILVAFFVRIAGFAHDELSCVFLCFFPLHGQTNHDLRVSRRERAGGRLYCQNVVVEVPSMSVQLVNEPSVVYSRLGSALIYLLWRFAVNALLVCCSFTSRDNSLKQVGAFRLLQASQVCHTTRRWYDSIFGCSTQQQQKCRIAAAHTLLQNTLLAIDRHNTTRDFTPSVLYLNIDKMSRESSQVVGPGLPLTCFSSYPVKCCMHERYITVVLLSCIWYKQGA